jgi:hypothetical protein
MDAESPASLMQGATSRWLMWAGWLCVVGIAFCAVPGSMEVDRLGY